MHLVSFSVQNFRSITKAHKIRIGRSTVLIGPNNEGKSNLLRALVTSMQLLRMSKERLDKITLERLRREPQHRTYDWERDFPIPLQETKPNGESVFRLEFELSEEDVEGFWTEVRSRINGTLPIQVAIGQKGATIKVMKKGPGGQALSAKRDLIAQFVAKRVDIQHIPAVRTAQSAVAVVEQLVARELLRLENDAEYQTAVEAVALRQKPLLDTLSKSIQETLAVFLPDVKKVAIEIPQDERYRALRRSEILIDDGTETELRYKGDGVQSLAALALTRHMSETGALGKNLLVAIEEPEAHLHPKAIHQVRMVLKELASRHRLVLATHCPLFVDRSDIRNNILVTDNRARPASGIGEVREILGVRASDNLQQAEIVLLVEGEDDKIAFEALLREHSTKLRAALDDGALAVEAVGGASNYVYKASLVRDALCELHLFLDADAAGKNGADDMRRQGIATDAEINFATCLGMVESELEDLYSVDVYKDSVQRLFGVRLDIPMFRGAKKWSQRAKQTFQRQGKVWDDYMSMKVKRAVAEAVAASPGSALEPGRRDSFDALIQQLERRVTGDEPSAAEGVTPSGTPT